MIDDVRALLGLARRIQDAIKGAGEVKTLLRERMAEYCSILERLASIPGDNFSSELVTLRGLLEQMEELQSKHIVDVHEDGKAAKACRIATRGSLHTSIKKQLDDIDRGVMRQLSFMTSKAAIDLMEMKRNLDMFVGHVTTDTTVTLRGPLDLSTSHQAGDPRWEAWENALDHAQKCVDKKLRGVCDLVDRRMDQVGTAQLPHPGANVF